MPFSKKTPISMMAALGAAALTLPLSAQAQDGGFAVQLAMSPDYYELPRVSVSLFGTTAEPASSYVRGCAGYVTSEAAGAQFDVPEPLEALAFTVVGDGVKAMVIGTPDGLFRCVLADENGYAAQTLPGSVTGRYRVWAAAPDNSPLNAQVYAAPRPVSPIELFGFDLSTLGEPRLGRALFAATGERQVLAEGAPLVARDPMDVLNTPETYCAGYGGLDAPDMILSVDAPPPVFSLFAQSDRDLTMAVVTPTGQILCNDDTYQLNPAISVEGGMPGDYAVFVGGFSEGSGDYFTLMASQGPAAFNTATVNLDAEPRHGRVALDLDAAVLGQVIGANFLSARDSFENLPTGGFCPGFGDLSAPDYMVTVDDADMMVSLYAQSADDLVLAVRDPNGAWYCNDDSNGLNPAVVIGATVFGDYAVYVGGYSNASDGGQYTLFAALGQPNWQGATSIPATPGGAVPGIDPDSAPLLGSIGFGADTVLDPRVILDVRSSVTDVYGLGGACAGFIDLSAPDIEIVAGESLTQMMIYMVSDADTTMVVIGPDGTLYCNDDFEELNPAVVIASPQPGGYRVYTGTYGGDGGVATLGVTSDSPLWSMDSVQ